MFRTTSRTMFKMLNISVDGNISSGKSTLVSKLVDSFPRIGVDSAVEVIPEPLGKWCDMKGHNLLGMFYENPVKNNFMFQHYVQLTRLMDTVKQMNLKQNDISYHGKRPLVRLMERSLQNNRYCFTELARKQGDLQDPEFAVLVEWYDWLEQNLDLKLDCIIYLRTTPDIVYSRMKSRGRAEEATVPLDYLTALHDTYEDWLIHQNNDKTSERKQEVIVVNANQSKERVFEETHQLLAERITRIMSELLSRPNSNGHHHQPYKV